LNNVNGSLLEVLRSCLITGYNPRSVSSIVVASGVATATIATHGYSAVIGQRVLIEGAPHAGLNGVIQPTSVATNTLVYSAPGVPDGTYTGTISSKRAPLGWTEPFTGANVAIFSRTLPEARTSIKLRVVDTGASPAASTYASAIMVYDPTGVDTFSAQAPTVAQASGGVIVTKNSNTASAKNWVLIGEDRGFHLFVGDTGSPSYLYPALQFFDLETYRVGDSMGVVLGGTGTTATNNGASNLANATNLVSSPSGYTSVAFSGGVSSDPVPVAATGAYTATAVMGAPQAYITNDPDRIVLHRPVYVRDTEDGVRGHIPGYEQPLASHQAFPSGWVGVITAEDGSSHLYVKVRNFSNNGVLVFSLQDDWYAA
jgi:hypothetical protein